MLGKRAKKPIELVLKAKEAKQIFDWLYVDELSVDEISIEKNTQTWKTKKVINEANRLEAEINLLMSGKKLLQQAEYDSEGVEIKPAVYYQPTTEEDLIAQLDSVILNVAKVVKEVRRWSDGNPDNAPTWEDYKASFEAK